MEELLTVTSEVTSEAMIVTVGGEIDPMNAARLAHRRRALEAGQWVLDAAEAHAAKQRRRTAA